MSDQQKPGARIANAFRKLFRRGRDTGAAGGDRASAARASGNQVSDLAAATEIARAALVFSDEPREYAIFADRTQEHDFGWVFFYNSKAYVETGDMKHQVPGCGPLLVLRENGETQFLPTYRPPSLLIEEFAREWREQRRS